MIQIVVVKYAAETHVGASPTAAVVHGLQIVATMTASFRNVAIVTPMVRVAFSVLIAAVNNATTILVGASPMAKVVLGLPIVATITANFQNAVIAKKMVIAALSIPIVVIKNAAETPVGAS